METVGCFGDHTEDRHFARQLHRHLDGMDAASARTDAMADDLYRQKVAQLPVTHHQSSFFKVDILNLDDVIGELNTERTATDYRALACAVRDNQPEVAGQLLIKLITNRLREEAQEEAEENQYD